MDDEPGHQELCNREQELFLDAIRHDRDMSGHVEDAINSLRIVLAADESVRTGQVVTSLKLAGADHAGKRANQRGRLGISRQRR